MKKFIIVFLLILGSLFLYTLTIKGIKGNPGPSDFKNNLDQATKPFELSPERGRYAQVISLVNGHRFDLSQTLADAVYPDVGFYKGRFYAFFAPGVSLLAAPFYAIGSKFNLGQVVTFSFSSVFAILTAVVTYFIGRKVLKLNVAGSLLACLIYMFGSTSWSYATTLYQHQVSAFLIFSSFFAAWYFRNGSKKYYRLLCAFYIWFAYALGLLIDYPNGLFMLPVMIYFAFSAFNFSKFRRRIKVVFKPIFFLTIVGFVLVSGFHAYYNISNFGAWNHLSGNLVSYKRIVENLSPDERTTQAIARLQERKNPVKFFSEEKFPVGLYTLLVSPDRGLFIYSPIFILSIFGIIYALRKTNIEIVTLLGILFLVLFLYSSWADPSGGWAFGPRYLIPVLPILSLFVSFWLYNFESFGKRIITFILFVYSSAVALVGVLTTNAIPPKVEADYLHTGYNFLYNISLLEKGMSSSFIYNNFASNYLSLVQYYFVIYAFVLFICIGILFVFPSFLKKEGLNEE